MKTPQQEITETLLANAGNRLTSELIAGLQARLNNILDRALAAQSETKLRENKDD